MQNKKSLRIGIDARVLQDKRPSGIPQYAFNVIREMLKIDGDNKFVLFYNSFRKIEKDLPQFEGNIETKIYHWPNKFLEWFWKFIPYPKIDKVLNVDIFFSPHFLNIPLSQDVKKVVTIHDLSFIKNKRYFSFIKNIWHWQMDPKTACTKFNKIISVSEATKKDIVDQYQINPGKIKTIYNGARKIYDSGQDYNFRLKRFGLDNQRYLLFLATLEPRKNIEGIIDAFALIHNQIPDFKLVIAGKKGWLFKNIFKKVKNYKLENKIIFTDFVSNEEKHALFNKASLFLFPSFCEGFGLPVIEAKNYSLPVITSAISSMPEIIKDAAILINPHNINDLAIMIVKTLGDDQLKKIFERKMNKIRESSWQDCSRQTLNYLLS